MIAALVWLAVDVLLALGAGWLLRKFDQED